MARGDRRRGRAPAARSPMSHGAASILNAHYTGTCALIDTAFPQRFFNRLGATEVEPDTVCNNAGHVALTYVYGSSEDGFDPEAAADAACIVVWGANPSASAPHAHDHWLREARGEVIVIDPIRTPTGDQADAYLQVRPGSDAALAFALAHVIRREGLVDEAFVAEHVLGYDELEPLLEPCTPAWGEEQTGVPASLIEHVARTYGRGPSLLWMGQGLQRQPRGGNVMRAIGMLPALTGNIRRPGSGFLYLNGGDSRGIDWDWLAGSDLARPGRARGDQPDGSRGGARRPGAQPRARVLEHQPGRLEPGAGRAARGARARGSADRRVRPLPHRHRGVRRLRAPRGGLPGERRHPAVVLPPHALGAGEGRRTARARAAQLRDLPPPGRRDGLRRARPAGGRRRADRAPAGAVRRGLGRARARRHRAPLRRAARAVPRRLPDAERAHRDRLGDRRGRRPPAPARAERRRAAAAPATCGCSRRPRPG